MRDSGVLFICNLTNTAENGFMPSEELVKVNKYWFEMRTVGVTRSYQAKSVNERIDMLVRIPRDLSIQIGQYAMLGNGDQYRISMVSHGHETWSYTRQYKTDFVNGYRSPQINGLDYTELTLSKLENYYAVKD